MVISWRLMPAKKHFVVLNPENRLALERAARSNKRALRERLRARVLLAAAEGQNDVAIAAAVGVHVNTVANLRRRFAASADGVKTVRRAEQKKRKARQLDGRAEAHLVALVGGAPPAGRKRWSLHLLAGKLIEAAVVDTVSHETVRQTLKKMSSSRG